MTRPALSATLTGLLDLADPNPAHITVPDLAHRLALTNRWTGVPAMPLSVATHSVSVAALLPHRQRIYGLLHDAHEAYIGDLTSPAEALLERRVPGFRQHLDRVKADLDSAIRNALGVPHPDVATLAAVADADRRLAATEWLRLIPAANGPWAGPEQPIRQLGFKPIAWPDAETLFLENLERELALRGWEEEK